MDYLDFCSKVRFNSAWSSLKYKYENNIKADEYTLYQQLVDESSLIALNADMNHNLCEALSYIYGFAFCDYGYAAWNVIKEYFDNNKINIDLEQVKLNVIKRKVKSVGNLADEEFYGYIDEMFSDNPKTKEVKLVLECYRIIKSLQPMKNYALMKYYDLVDKALDELKESVCKTKDVISVDLDKYIPSDMPGFDLELDESVRLEILDTIKEKLETFSNKYPEYSFDEIIIITISYMCIW
jgi:hypothetical protein